MKSLYLILATTAVVVMCKPQRSNDIIWYPVDDEDGVFISTFGEKHRTTNSPKWRSHRRARYSGMEQPLPLSYDPSENYDPSFFHDIQERRPFTGVPFVPNIRPFFNDHPKQVGGQGNQNWNGNNYQDILNEVFDYNKNPLTGLGGTNQWNSRPTNPWLGNQWNGGQTTGDQWGNSVQRPGNQWGNFGQRPGGQLGNTVSSGQTQGSQWGVNSGQTSGGQWGNNVNSGRPATSEWITPDTRPGSRPTGQSDKLVFPEPANTNKRPTKTTTTTTTTPSNLLPTDPPTMSPCELSCPVTPEFNPVCGSDGVTYSNAGRLKCARLCGKDVRLSHYGNCGRTPFSTPLVSSNPRIFW